MKLANLCILALFLTAACAPITTITPINSNTYEAKPDDCSIQVMTLMPAQRTFEELAILNSRQTEGEGGVAELIQGLKITACHLGADAILIKQTRESDPHSRASVTAVAIKFTN